MCEYVYMYIYLVNTHTHTHTHTSTPYTGRRVSVINLVSSDAEASARNAYCKFNPRPPPFLSVVEVESGTGVIGHVRRKDT
jgi:hypothetical protein